MEYHQEQVNTANISKVTTGPGVLNYFGYIVFIVVVLETALMFGMNLYEGSKIETTNQEISTQQNKLASADYKTINTQVNEVISGQALLKQTIDQKVKWANFYDRLNQITPKDVRFTSMTLNENGTFQANGETISPTSLAKMLVALQNGAEGITTPFSSIVLGSNGFSTGASGKVVTFSITGQIKAGEL